MELKDITSEYKHFYEAFSVADSCLEYAIKGISDFLSDYYQLENYDEILSDNIELNLAYLNNIYDLFDEIYRCNENITLLDEFAEKLKFFLQTQGNGFEPGHVLSRT